MPPAAVRNGRQRPTAVNSRAAELHHRRMASNPTLLPKLGVDPPLVRAGSVSEGSSTGIGGRQRSPTVQRNRRSPTLQLKQQG
jgi:hypothetical protein